MCAAPAGAKLSGYFTSKLKPHLKASGSRQDNSIDFSPVRSAWLLPTSAGKRQIDAMGVEFARQYDPVGGKARIHAVHVLDLGEMYLLPGAKPADTSA